MNVLAKVGWGLFWFFSILGVLMALRFVPAGIAHGFIPSLDKGFWAALYDGVYIGLKEDFRHIFYHVQDRFTPLMTHMMVGIVPMLLIPFQLWRGFRNRHRALHRWMGRAIIVGILFSAWGASQLALNMNIPAWGRAGFLAGITVWIGSALIAFWAIFVQRNVARHQWWMVVVAAMTFGAVGIRTEFPIWRQFFPFEIAYAYAAWSSWVGNLVLVTLWRLWQRPSRGTAS